MYFGGRALCGIMLVDFYTGLPQAASQQAWGASEPSGTRRQSGGNVKLFFADRAEMPPPTSGSEEECESVLEDDGPSGRA